MSHEISKIDRQEGIEQAWHGLTDVRADLSLDNCWLSKWDVVKTPLFTQDLPTKWSMLTASDNRNIQIGKPFADSYVPVTNKDFLEMIKESILGIKGVKVASVGSVCERGRVFVSLSLSELESFKAAGREFKAYLNALNSHDFSSVLVMNTSNTCTVCNNTFRANLHAKGDKGSVNIRVKHTKNVKMRLDNIPEIIDGFLGAQAEFKALMDGFEATPIAEKYVSPLFAGFLGADEKDGLSTRKMGQVDTLTNLFKNGAGNRGKDLSDVFSAVTDYYTHESSGGEDRTRQFVSSEFGSGLNAKTRMFGLLQDKDAINKTVLAGKKILAASFNN